MSTSEARLVTVQEVVLCEKGSDLVYKSVFAMKGRRETGLWFPKRVGLRVGFLRSGVIRACLNAERKIPLWRDVLTVWVSAGTTAGEMAWRRWDGIGSNGQVVGWPERMSLETSASESGEKYVNEFMFAGKMFDRLWFGKLCSEVCNFINEECAKVVSC